MFHFNKWGLKWKCITIASYFEEKSPIFFSKTWNFSQKCIFLYIFFYFCFLPIIMFNFNKWVLKWKLITTFSYLENKIEVFFKNLKFYAETNVFLSNFFLIFFCNLYVKFHKWGLKWNDMIHSIYFSKKSDFFSNLTMMKLKKNGKPTGRRNLCRNFYKC